MCSFKEVSFFTCFFEKKKENAGVIGAYIFDLDGTLVDSLGGIADSLNASLAVVGIAPYRYEEVRGFIGRGIGNLINKALPEGKESDFQEVLEGMKHYYALHWQEGATLYKGVESTLKVLAKRGKPLAVLSNKPHFLCERFIAELLGDIPFFGVWGQRNGIAEKPDPQVALTAAKQCGISPAHIAFVGDSSIDIQTAKAANMLPIGVSYGYEDQKILKDLEPYVILDSFSEILSL